MSAAASAGGCSTTIPPPSCPSATSGHRTAVSEIASKTCATAVGRSSAAPASGWSPATPSSTTTPPASRWVLAATTGGFDADEEFSLSPWDRGVRERVGAVVGLICQPGGVQRVAPEESLWRRVHRALVPD